MVDKLPLRVRTAELILAASDGFRESFPVSYGIHHTGKCAMSNAMVIWGAAGHARVLREFLPGLGFRLVALFDNVVTVSPFDDVPLFVGPSAFLDWRRKCVELTVHFLVAVGGAGKDRLTIHSMLTAAGLTPATVVHPRGYVANSARLSSGSQVLANAVLAADAIAGVQCILNTGCTVDHESKLGDGVHIAPGATLAGCVEVGDCAFIGAGAVVLPRIKIGRHSVVGAGAVVTRDIPDSVVAHGVPARVVRSIR